MRVLVVEDEERLAEGLRRGLEAEGFATDVATNGTDGLWMAREHPYDGYDVHLTMFACKLVPGAEPHALSVKDVKWVGSGEFTEYTFPPADQATMDQLLGVKRWP